MAHNSSVIQTAVPFLLFALNLLIAWRLLTQEYTNHYDSIEPFFYAIAAHLKSNWLHPGWWPNWNCGMPFRYTYQPLVHHIVAAVSALAGWSTARAFHFVLALFYAAGPVTLYFLVRRLSGSFRIACAAALCYSLCSPSTWLMPEMAIDTDGLLNARRLHNAVVYGDGPYVCGLTLVPLALLLLHRAVQARSLSNLFLAALAVVAVPLTNIPAALTLAMALLAYVLSAEPAERISRLVTIAACSLSGYAFVAPLIPPSALLLTARNTRWMDPQGELTASKLLWLAAGLLALILISLALRRLRASPFAHFSALFLLIAATVVLGRYWFGFSVLAQPMRFHIALEMAIAMSVAALTGMVTLRKRWAIALAGTLVTIAVCWQIGRYRLYARKIVKHEPIWSRSEYKISQWLDRNAAGARVWVPGSVSFWFNSLTVTPQLTGCCDQSFLFQAPRIATYQMGSDDGAGARAASISIAWMQTMGVKYVALSGPRSTEAFHVTHHPAKFNGLLPLRWHSGDDAIYEIPGPPASLAHWIAPAEAIARMPVNGIDIAPLLPYAAAVSDLTRPPARMRWIGSRQIVIDGAPRAGELLSLQIPFHFGWRAEKQADSSTGAAVPIGQDALGFLLLRPNCNGPCTVNLVFDGGVESKALLALAAFAWLVAGTLLIGNRFMPHNETSA